MGILCRHSIRCVILIISNHTSPRITAKFSRFLTTDSIIVVKILKDSRGTQTTGDVLRCLYGIVCHQHDQWSNTRVYAGAHVVAMCILRCLYGIVCHQHNQWSNTRVNTWVHVVAMCVLRWLYGIVSHQHDQWSSGGPIERCIQIMWPDIVPVIVITNRNCDSWLNVKNGEHVMSRVMIWRHSRNNHYKHIIQILWIRWLLNRNEY